MRDHLRFGMVFTPPGHPIRQQRALACARLPRDQDRPKAFCLHRCIERLKIVLPRKIESPAGGTIGFVPQALLRQGIRHFAFRKRLIDQFPEVPLDPLRHVFGLPIILHHGESAGADPVLQRLELRPLRRVFTQVGTTFFPRVGGIAEIKKGAVFHRWIVQHAVEYLQFRHALAAAMLIQPWLFKN